MDGWKDGGSRENYALAGNWAVCTCSKMIDGNMCTIKPKVEIEKPVYVLGENMRIWVGVGVEDGKSIPQNVWDTCYLTVTRPDGTMVRERASWPIDGALDRGWMGGHGLADKIVGPGKYRLQFEVADKKSPLVETTIVEWAELKLIYGGFTFEPVGVISANQSVSVTFWVKNKTKETIRFPVRSNIAGGVSIRVTRKEPPESAGFFYPPEKLILPEEESYVDKSRGFLADASVEERMNYMRSSLMGRYNWQTMPRIPTIVLKPGESFEQNLRLEEAYKFWGPGDYKVTFSTVLDVLVGEKDGKLASACPMRVLVTGVGMFKVQALQP